MLVVGRRVIPWMLERIAGTGSRELFTLSVLAIALGVAFGSAELFGVSFALGAFFAGMLLNESELSHKAAQDSLPMRDAFAVLFFVSVGMLFDPHILVEHPWLVLATACIIIVRQVAGRVRHRARVRPSQRHRADHFRQPGADRRVRLHHRRPRRDAEDPAARQAQDLVLAGALISIMLNPLIFGLLDRWQARQKRRRRAGCARRATALAEDAAAIACPTTSPTTPSSSATAASAASWRRCCSARGVPVVVIDDNADSSCTRARGRHPGSPRQRRVRTGDAPKRARSAPRSRCSRSRTRWKPAKPSPGCKALNPDITVLARAHSDAEVKHLLEHGADGAVLAERELAYSLAEMVMATPPYRPLRASAA